MANSGSKDLTWTQIESQILKPNNYDMRLCYSQLAWMAHYDSERRNTWLLNRVFGFGVLGISGYNLSRMGVLSKTGKAGAVAGIFVGLLNITYADD